MCQWLHRPMIWAQRAYRCDCFYIHRLKIVFMQFYFLSDHGEQKIASDWLTWKITSMWFMHNEPGGESARGQNGRGAKSHNLDIRRTQMAYQQFVNLVEKIAQFLAFTACRLFCNVGIFSKYILKNLAVMLRFLHSHSCWKLGGLSCSLAY